MVLPTNCITFTKKYFTMAKVLIPFKGEEELKEAIRVVAFNQGHSNSSKTVYDIIRSNPLIAKELKKMQRCGKNKVVAN